jgi:hypothetical protein
VESFFSSKVFKIKGGQASFQTESKECTKAIFAS